MNPFTHYPVLKISYPIQIIDLRFPVDHINLKKAQLFEKYKSNTNIARMFHRKIQI